ncbi:hypothetical protein J2797_006695, partial [Paraburkholderia terricola]|nr:hypothetical protein [Paraburkholderia terricola]
MLANCDANQTSLNFCAWRDKVIAEQKLQDAYFTPSWTAISRQAGQAFHAKVGTDFTASWT